MSKHKKHLQEDLENCNCNQNCNCEEDCSCNEDCTCNETCTCNKENHCSENFHCHESEECDCNKTCNDEKCECENECTCQECECENNQLQYLELAQRVQAEFDNYRKRTKEAETIARQNGIIFAVEKLLPVIDSVDNAKKQVEDENFKKALDLVNTQIMQCLESLGVKKIEALGKEFNPNYHNAILTGTDLEKLDDEVLEEFQAGFTLNDKVIRHSVVRVNKL